MTRRSRHASIQSLQEFLAKYEERAQGQGTDVLGYYIAPWAYAQMEVLAQAVEGDGPDDHGEERHRAGQPRP
jgi:hypothetical protein